MKSIEGNFDNPEVNEMLIKHFIELRSVSPKDSCHVLDIEGLKVSSIKFWSLWDDDKLMGCGALKILGHRKSPAEPETPQMQTPCCSIHTTSADGTAVPP